jgi:hypothetical protein
MYPGIALRQARLYTAHRGLKWSTIRQMPVIDVGGRPGGPELEYLDSGRPSSQPYETMVVVHGNSWGASEYCQLVDRSDRSSLQTIPSRVPKVTGRCTSA